jgi:hypothetical protein
MKIHRLPVGAVALSLFAVVLSGLLWWAGTPARAAFAPTVALVPVSGTVSGQPESVRFSGQARISSELVLDSSRTRPPHPPSVILIIDLSGVSGTGSSTGAKYTAGGDGTPMFRQLASADTVEITFPFTRGTTMSVSSAGMSSVRSGVVTFALSFDTNTGAITNGTATVAAPNFPN